VHCAALALRRRVQRDFLQTSSSRFLAGLQTSKPLAAVSARREATTSTNSPCHAASRRGAASRRSVDTLIVRAAPGGSGSGSGCRGPRGVASCSSLGDAARTCAGRVESSSSSRARAGTSDSSARRCFRARGVRGFR